MKYYSGIDLGARKSQVCIIDDNLKVLLNEKMPNDRGRITQPLKPYRENLSIVIESTFNWYWLVDHLQDQEFDVHLAHTLGLAHITKAKVKTDRIDAHKLAKLLRAEMIPQAYIYPKPTRPIRDLGRRRLKLVRKRAAEYSYLRRCLYQYGVLDHTRNSIKAVEEEDLARWFVHPIVRLHAGQEVERIKLYNRQIQQLEENLLATVRGRREFARLQQIPGIGPILAITIFYEIGDIHRFETARNFSSFSRLVPGTADSSDRSRRGRGSKQGNAHLKWALTHAVQYARRVSPKIQRCYDKHLQRHRGKARKLIANNIVAHKLAQAVYRILRDGVDYNEELLFGK